jgi:hypothetical protein
MRRLTSAVAALVLGGGLSLGAALPASAAVQRPQFLQCESGYVNVIDDVGFGYALAGEGINNPVQTTSRGGCWHFVTGIGAGGDYYALKDEGGNCLNYSVALGGVVDVATSCNYGSTQQQWRWNGSLLTNAYASAHGDGPNMTPDTISNGSEVTTSFATDQDARWAVT